MIQLVTLPPTFGLRNVSPFCLKIEMLLTSLGLDFDTTDIQDPRKAPKGKLPYLIVDDVVLPDSELIVEFLEKYTQGKVYAGLSDAQKAQGFALTRLVEDHLYWLMVASRWLDDDWWPNIVNGFFGFVPALIRPIATGMARKKVRSTYDLHGLGRHTLLEQKGFAKRDLQALEHSVPETGFLFGETPCVFDFTVASLMAGMYDQQPETWITPMAQQCQTLQAYTERVQAAVGVYGRYT
jgi:glutathione S-transferase